MSAIAMFNALWFRPDDGAARYAEYGAAVLPILEDVGAEVVVPFLPVEQVLEGDVAPDLVGVVRYPSAEAFERMWRSDRYQAIAHLRTEAVTEAVLTRCAIDPPDGGAVELEPGVAVLNLLWFHDGGRQRYDEYLAAAAPLAAAHGGRFVSPRFVPEEAVQGALCPDLVFLGNYPSLDAVLALVSDPAYEEAAAIRTRAVRRSATSILRVGPPGLR